MHHPALHLKDRERITPSTPQEEGYAALAESVIRRAMVDAFAVEGKRSAELSVSGRIAAKKDALDFLQDEERLQIFSLLSGLSHGTIRTMFNGLRDLQKNGKKLSTPTVGYLLACGWKHGNIASVGGGKKHAAGQSGEKKG